MADGLMREMFGAPCPGERFGELEVVDRLQWVNVARQRRFSCARQQPSTFRMPLGLAWLTTR